MKTPLFIAASLLVLALLITGCAKSTVTTQGTTTPSGAPNGQDSNTVGSAATTLDSNFDSFQTSTQSTDDSVNSFDSSLNAALP